jgi:hypothetical protein
MRKTKVTASPKDSGSSHASTFKSAVSTAKSKGSVSDSAKADAWGIRDGQQDTSHIPAPE